MLIKQNISMSRTNFSVIKISEKEFSLHLVQAASLSSSPHAENVNMLLNVTAYKYKYISG